MRNIIFCIALMTCLSLQAKSTHHLTGIIESAESHLVTAPKARNWQVQIQWMAEEGTIVQKGDLVTVFDSGGIQTELEQNEEQLVMERLELEQIEMRVVQAVVEAKGRLDLAKIMVNKSQIQASIPDGEISDYEKGKHVIAYEKALVEKIKAEEKHKRKVEEQKVSIEKQKIQILKLEERITYNKSQLAKMSVRSKVTGPVSHMMHPHMGGKISSGINVQVGWKILTVQAQSGYQVKSWIHELDASRVVFDGADIFLLLDAYPGKKYKGKVITLSSQAEQKTEWSNSAYYAVKIGFSESPKDPIFPGMSVRVDIHSQEQPLAGGVDHD